MPKIILEIEVPEIMFIPLLIEGDVLSQNGNLVLNIKCDTEARELFLYMAMAQARVSQASNEHFRQANNIQAPGEVINKNEVIYAVGAEGAKLSEAIEARTRHDGKKY